MKRTSIRAGVVYAAKSSYGPPSPVVFLEDGAAGLYQRDARGGHGFVQVTESSYTKARRGSGWGGVTYGYAAIVQSWTARGDGDPLLAMRAADAAAELERFRAGGKPASDLLQFDLFTTLNRIVPWDEAMADYDAGREADRRRTAAADARRTRTMAAVAALGQHGISAKRVIDGTGEAVAIGIEDTERLLAMLGGEG